MNPRSMFVRLGIVLALAFVTGCQSSSGIYNVRHFGARGDGFTIDTHAVNDAIRAAARKGGGTVRFPAGQYLCYSIHLKSNVSLYLEQGSVIVAAGSPQAGSYDAPEPNPFDPYEDFGHSHWHNSLMWGENIHDVAIEGPGMIFGRGLHRGHKDEPVPFPTTQPYSETADAYAEKDATKPSTEPSYPSPTTTLADGIGNKSIALKNSRNVTIRDISILQGGHFAILATGVDNLTIDNVTIDTNRDGMDIDVCRNVRVSNCTVNSPWDDGIVLKSDYSLGIVRPTEDVTITNCMVSGGYQMGSVIDGTFKKVDAGYAPFGKRPPRTGRIKLGTEATGGFRNIVISNCILDNCAGLALESVDGSPLEDVSISNIVMRDMVSDPIFIRLGERERGPAGMPVSIVRRISISDIVATSAAAKFACIISGIPDHPIEDLSLSDIHLFFPGGAPATRDTVPEKPRGYPDATMFGEVPAYGFYIRHADRVSLTNIDIRTLRPDPRPPFALDDVHDVTFDGVRAGRQPQARDFLLHNVTNLRVNQASLPTTRPTN